MAGQDNWNYDVPDTDEQWAYKLAFVLRDLVYDEEIGMLGEGELWLRARKIIAQYDAKDCCGEEECIFES